MRKNKITEIDGRGRLTSPTSVAVTEDGETSSYTCDDLIVAVGAQPRLIPCTQRSRRVVTYEELILDDGLPTSVIIAGSGAIGVKFAYVLSTFGVDVTIVEFLDRMVPTEDVDVSNELLRQYRKLGLTVLLSTKVTDVDDSSDKVSVTVCRDGKQQVLEADKLLQAIGFQPRTEGYGLQETGVTLTERGAIAVDGRGRTNVEHLYAIGYVTGKMMLAHAAEAMGIIAAETIAGAQWDLTADELSRNVIAHPTLSEAVKEALHGITGHMINL